MARSESEETTKASFNAFLRKRLPASTPRWYCGEDPPDYYLEFLDEKFAVDVSILVNRMNLGRAKLPLRVVRDTFAKFINEIKLSAKQAGILHGKYIVYIPRPIPKLRQAFPLLRERILNFVTGTCDSPTGVVEEFCRIKGRRCVIQKTGQDGSALLAGGPRDSRWANEAERELADLVAERIAAKADDLRQIAMPKMLLLDEQYLFAEGSMYDAIARPASGTSDFHTIYVYRHGFDGILLTSCLRGFDGIWDR